MTSKKLASLAPRFDGFTKVSFWNFFFWFYGRASLYAST